MKQLFTQEDAWHGGFFEVVFEIAETSEATIKRILARLWSNASVEGCFLERDIEPVNQQRISPLANDLQRQYYGIAMLPNLKQCVCGTYWSTNEENGYWITFYLPLGSLSNAYPIGSYPFYSDTEPSSHFWIQEVSTWLKDIANDIYSHIPFKSAIVGFGVGPCDASELLKNGIPPERWYGLLLPGTQEVRWYPPTTYQAPYKLEKRLL